ncbi:MAG: flavodoxin domain-containing protein [Dissulfuribacterales bacterium]
MKKVLIAYESRKGHTENMANYIAEGARMTGNKVEVRALGTLKSEDDIKRYDAYLFGCPTYHRDMTNSMKTFLFLADSAGLEGKIAGSFGSYTHSGDAPKLILDTMENVFHMNATNLGSFNLLEDKVETDEGMRACQQYGRAVTE